MELAPYCRYVPEHKVLVCGDVNGNFRILFQKVQSIQKNQGHFECLFCVGNFFGPYDQELEDLKSGKIYVPIETYILGPNKDVHIPHYDFRGMKKINYLGKAGTKRLHGLQVSYLSGLQFSAKETPSCTDSSKSIYFERKHIEKVIHEVDSEYRTVDILLTSLWPKDVTTFSGVCFSFQDRRTIDKWSSSLVSEVAKQLKPRYHFSGLTGIYLQRQPFRNDADMDKELTSNVTRFCGLGYVSSEAKQKWLYGFKIRYSKDLAADEMLLLPESSTVSPYLSDESTKVNPAKCFVNTPEERHRRDSLKRPHDEYEPYKVCKCWFCFDYEGFEKHLIIALGNHSYVALAKGILVPEHVLIIPLDHIPSSAYFPDELIREIELYKKSLANYFHDKNKDVVIYERAFRSCHAAIQVVPVPKHMKSEILEALFSEAEACNAKFIDIPNPIHMLRLSIRPEEYFYFEIMVNKETVLRSMHTIKRKFPLQFGRAVLANSKVLNVVDRVEWKKCEGSSESEKQMAENMKRAFSPYVQVANEIDKMQMLYSF